VNPTALKPTVTEDTHAFISMAGDMGASDIAFSPNAHPTLRVNSQWLPQDDYETLNERDLIQIINMTHPSLRDHDAARDALLKRHRLNYATTIGNHNFRVNVGVTNALPFIIMRTISRNIPSIDDLEVMPPTQRGNLTIDLEATLYQIATAKRGLVIVTGATGSGKSTTLAGMIRHYNETRHGHIITIEDPIEFIHKRVCCMIHQRLVDKDGTGDVESFDKGVEDAMRQAPDVILIGEVRDGATMRAALQAAETGHLVFCTLHTRDAPSTIMRILGFFAGTEQDAIRVQVANSLLAIISQQLVPRSRPSDRNGRMRQLVLEIMRIDNAIKSMLMAKDINLQSVRDGIKSSGELGNITMDDELARAVKLSYIDRERAVEYAVDPDRLKKAVGAR